jgi:hypothetical protein
MMQENLNKFQNKISNGSIELSKYISILNNSNLSYGMNGSGNQKPETFTVCTAQKPKSEAWIYCNIHERVLNQLGAYKQMLNRNISNFLLNKSIEAPISLSALEEGLTNMTKNLHSEIFLALST